MLDLVVSVYSFRVASWQSCGLGRRLGLKTVPRHTSVSSRQKLSMSWSPEADVSVLSRQCTLYISRLRPFFGEIVQTKITE